jgi:hypothetical protein
VKQITPRAKAQDWRTPAEIGLRRLGRGVNGFVLVG